MPGVFVDTNVIVYAFSDDPRSKIANLILRQSFLTSVQALNEFANVARRRLGMTLAETEASLKTIRILCGDLRVVDLETHEGAIRLLHHYNFSFYDALMISAALLAGCETLLSEDMQHGLKVDGRLSIINPFL